MAPYDVASNIQYSPGPDIQRTLNPRLWSQTAPYDVASNINIPQALSHGGEMLAHLTTPGGKRGFIQEVGYALHAALNGEQQAAAELQQLYFAAEAGGVLRAHTRPTLNLLLSLLLLLPRASV